MTSREREPYAYTSYGGTPPHVKGSETSEAAAKKVVKTISGGHRAVLGALRGAVNGLTDEEIRDFTLLKESTERPRRRELVLLGKVRDSGRKRRTASGSPAVVWELVPTESEDE